MDENKEDWCTISFPVIFLEEVRIIETKLAGRGISFDTGTGFGARDWQLDWSLKGATPKEVIDMLKEISPTLFNMIKTPTIFGMVKIYPYSEKTKG